ncbi:MAG: type I glyceraldehyde-3-phosphate dehydrogenase [Oscillospiraceae bacterium]|nr:type I glyceraldehyde-3-phosphate dehydrogenase [Oscillospiraceae bacterium]
MSTRIAINGFGRIGRLAFRQIFGTEGYEIVAINDLADPAMLANLLKYDSTQGRYELYQWVQSSDTSIFVAGKEVKIFNETKPENLPWKELNIDLVIDSTGLFLTKEALNKHIIAGAKKVLVSAPAKDNMPTIVYGINHETLKAEDRIISAASCTTNCLAPMVKALNEFAPIQHGIMTTVHAYTGDQMELDAPHKKGDMRRARAGYLNIEPNSTGAAKAIGLVLPELEGKLIGSAQRVPVPAGSTTILVAVVKGENITKEAINEAMRKVSNESFGYNEDPIVSSDIVGIRQGSLFDATQTMVGKLDEENTYQVQVVSWYDNETSYVSQMVRTMKYFAHM